MIVTPSPLDTERFGIRIGRAQLGTTSSVEHAILAAQGLDLEMVVLRVDADAWPVIHALEAAGAKLCDTLVYYGRAAQSAGVPTTGVRAARASDTDAVEMIAAASFAGYLGHYHADPRLERAAADAAYGDWARRSVTVPGVADRVWVVEHDGETAGFLTLRVNDAAETEIVLNAVHPDHQGRGLYPRLVEAALAGSAELGAARCIVSTQLANRPVQRVWVRLGFEPTAAYQTFHLWTA